MHVTTTFCMLLACMLCIACGSDTSEDDTTTSDGDTGVADTAERADTGADDTATPEDTAEPSEPTDVEVAADWLTGDFNSRAQAMADRRYFDVHLYAIQIWPEREDGVWMYVQQSRDDDDDGTYEAPYRQRVYRVHSPSGDGVVSTVYRISNEASVVDPWNDRSVLDSITEEALQLAEGCDVMLTREGDRFVGGTQGTGCTLSFGGYATSAVTLTEGQLQSLDLLYDDAGSIINGLTEDSTPYTFEKAENFPIVSPP
ncbi:MAG: chromophore lyase CpcT/CpeT [Myxococcota bacterium]